MNVVIAAAGLNPKMKINHNKCLVDIGGETIIERQIRLIKEALPESKITVVLGYEADKLSKLLPANINTIVNRDFEKTSVAYSLSVAMEYLDAKRKTLFVFGDMVFNKETLNLFEGTNQSIILIDEYKRINKDEVGVIISGSKVRFFDYETQTKFIPIFMLGAKELGLFRFFCKSKCNLSKCVHEILNTIIDCTNNLRPISVPKKLLIREIDTRKDLNQLKISMGPK